MYIALLIVILINSNVYAMQTNTEDEVITISDILDTWEKYSDDELNEIIANSEDNDIANFLLTLEEEEFYKILERNTMLLNEITVYSPKDTEQSEKGSDDNENIYVEQEIESKQIYWQYLIELAYTPQVMSIYASNKTGYFYLQISGDGTTAKYKIQITITDTDLANQQKATYSWVEITNTSNKKNFNLLWGSANTQLATKSGDRAYYEIVALKISYTKTAHYRCSSSYVNKVDGYRMNFSQYSYENNLPTTLNNTGHNENDTTEELYMQTNIMLCGMMNYSDGKTYHTTANLNLSLYYGGVIINPNGGTWNNTTETSSFVDKCTKTRTIKNPTRTGYVFIGWTVTKGSSSKGNINKNIYGSAINNDGCIFSYCGAHASGDSMANKYYTTLKANWKKVDDLKMPETGGVLKNNLTKVGISLIILNLIIYIKKIKKEIKKVYER